VEHIVAGVGTEMYMTDLQGRIRDTYGDEGIDSFTGNADIRVICQNPVLRVVDGTNFTIGVYQDRAIVDGSTVNLNTNAEQDDYFAILNRAQIAYEVVFRPLRFFQDLDNPDFPLGRKTSLRDTRDKPERIHLSYPDQFPSPRAFVEPKRLGDDFPLIHIKNRTSDGRLFGEAGSRPTLIPGELAHGLHFSFLSEAQRGRVQDEYVDFILSDVVAGGTGGHSFDARTTPEVAYIEAADWFGQNFLEFMRARQGGTSTLVTPEPITPAIQAEFVTSEWIRLTRPLIPRIRADVVLGFPPAPGAPPRILRPLRFNLARRTARPSVTGGDVEGAVYAAIFVDFASFVGLDFAASAYFEANALTFGQYREFIEREHPEHSEALETVRAFWGL
jgi:hypothetical protein